MTRIRRLYDKDQEVIIYNPLIEPFQIFLLDWLELGNLEIGNRKRFLRVDSIMSSSVIFPKSAVMLVVHHNHKLKEKLLTQA